jgi:hypothetical protein
VTHPQNAHKGIAAAAAAAAAAGAGDTQECTQKYSTACTEVKQVKMMHMDLSPDTLTGTPNVSYADVPEQYRAVRLPYKGSTGLAAIFVLPGAAYSSVWVAARGITAQKVMDPAGWTSLPDEVKLALPRFKVEVKPLDLNPVSACDNRSLQGFVRNIITATTVCQKPELICTIAFKSACSLLH